MSRTTTPFAGQPGFSIPREFLGGPGSPNPPAPMDVLANEVRSLRREVAALRDALTPPSSLILTGRDVVDEFRRMTA